MATIKNCTDLPQSKKLAEILPLESADMYYSKTKILNSDETDYIVKVGTPIVITDVPCWSLGALLDVLPEDIIVLGTIYSINIHTKNKKWFINYKCNNEEFIGAYSNIFVDTCYEMILKLNEQKIL